MNKNLHKSTKFRLKSVLFANTSWNIFCIVVCMQIIWDHTQFTLCRRTSCILLIYTILQARAVVEHQDGQWLKCDIDASHGQSSRCSLTWSLSSKSFSWLAHSSFCCASCAALRWLSSGRRAAITLSMSFCTASIWMAQACRPLQSSRAAAPPPARSSCACAPRRPGRRTARGPGPWPRGSCARCRCRSACTASTATARPPPPPPPPRTPTAPSQSRTPRRRCWARPTAPPPPPGPWAGCAAWSVSTPTKRSVRRDSGWPPPETGKLLGQRGLQPPPVAARPFVGAVALEPDSLFQRQHLHRLQRLLVQGAVRVVSWAEN